MKDLKKKIEKLLKDYLFQYGFRKERGTVYSRLEDEIKEGLYFGSSAHNEKHVCYLTYTAGVSCPVVEEVAYELNELVCGLGMNIGFLMPDYFFKEWRFAIDNSDEYIQYQVSDIISTVLEYAIPYFRKYSTQENLVYGLETRELRCSNGVRDIYLPILYYLRGHNAQAYSFVEEVIKRRTLDFPIDEYKAMQVIYGEEAIQIPPNKELDSYLPFAEKFKKMIEAEKS